MSRRLESETESQSNALRPKSATDLLRVIVRELAAPARWLITAVVVLVILRVTLSHIGDGYFRPFEFCIVCSRRWLSDGVLNVWLFVPLGMVVVWNTRSVGAGVLAGLLLSTAIEMAQTIMPGRIGALNDIVFNTLGATIGAAIAYRPRIWLFPNARNSLLLTVSGIAFAAFVMIATSILLSPINSDLLPNHESFHFLTSGGSTSADVIPLLAVDVPSEEPLVIGRAGNDLLLRYPSRTKASGLDQPEYWLPYTFTRGSGSDSAVVSVRRERAHWNVNIGGNRAGTLGPTVGEGWALLVYPRATGRRWGAVLNAIWIAALCFPIGFWARGRLLPTGALGVAALLMLIPIVAGIAPTSSMEWAGAGSALLAGALLGWRSGRAQPVSG